MSGKVIVDGGNMVSDVFIHDAGLGDRGVFYAYNAFDQSQALSESSKDIDDVGRDPYKIR